MKRTHYIIAIFGLLVAFSASALAQTPLTSLSGDRVDVQGQRGKVVILAIGASWLPLSEKQVEYTNVLAKKYAGRDVVIYFVATDSTAAKSRNYASADDLAKFSADHKLAVALLRDSDGAATLKKFSIDQVPSFVILDKQGNRAGEPFGGIDPKFDITVPISRVVDGLL